MQWDTVKSTQSRSIRTMYSTSRTPSPEPNFKRIRIKKCDNLPRTGGLKSPDSTQYGTPIPDYPLGSQRTESPVILGGSPTPPPDHRGVKRTDPFTCETQPPEDADGTTSDAEEGPPVDAVAPQSIPEFFEFISDPALRRDIVNYIVSMPYMSWDTFNLVLGSQPAENLKFLMRNAPGALASIAVAMLRRRKRSPKKSANDTSDRLFTQRTCRDHLNNTKYLEYSPDTHALLCMCLRHGWQVHWVISKEYSVGNDPKEDSNFYVEIPTKRPLQEGISKLKKVGTAKEHLLYSTLTKNYLGGTNVVFKGMVIKNEQEFEEFAAKNL